MKTKELISEIEKLPIKERIYVVECTVRQIRKLQEENQMKAAVEELYSDYKSGKELTVFTELDFESFYEAR